LVENRDIFIPRLHSNPASGWSRQNNIALTFGTESDKLKWWIYRTMKKLT